MMAAPVTEIKKTLSKHEEFIEAFINFFNFAYATS